MTSAIARAREALAETLRALEEHGPLTPGSLRHAIEHLLPGKAALLRVPVEAWNPTHHTGPGTPAPYTGPGSTTGTVHRVPGDPLHRDSWGRMQGRGIALTGPPRDPFHARRIALYAWEAGYDAVLIESGHPLPPVLGVWGYSWHAGSPSPIPVLTVPPGSVRPGTRVALDVGVEAVDRYEYNVVWGWGENPIIIGASYTPGAGDPRLQVAAAITLARILAGHGLQVHLALYTSTWAGAPGPAGWHWSWGARWHHQQLAASGMLDDAKAYITISLQGAGHLTVSGAPQHAHPAHHTLQKAGIHNSKGGWESPYHPGQSLAATGLPGITIHKADPWRPGTPPTPDTVAVLIAGLAHTIQQPPHHAALTASLHRVLRVNLHARLIYEAITRAAATQGWDHVYRAIARRWLATIYPGDPRLDSPTRHQTCILPQACALTIPQASQAHAIWISGPEQLLYTPRGRLHRQAASLLAQLLWDVREALHH